jgi:acyl-coenzyme A thioesterase PaaI-like protein
VDQHDSAFDRGTAVEARGDGRYAATLGESWTIGPGRPNGGYLLAVLGRAALARAAAEGADHPHVLAANVQYVSSPSTGPAVVDTEVLRIGRTASQLRARLVVDGRPAVEALLTTGRLAEGTDPWWGAVPPVALPAEEACRRLPSMSPDGEERPSIRDVAAVRFDPACLGFLDGRPDGSAELRGWFRFADDAPVSPLALLFVVDAFPPATFALARTGWVPTLDLTAYVRAVPVPGPLRMRFRARVVHDGFVDEVAEVWDAADRLVAQSTQLAAMRIPPGVDPPDPVPPGGPEA